MSSMSTKKRTLTHRVPSGDDLAVIKVLAAFVLPAGRGGAEDSRRRTRLRRLVRNARLAVLIWREERNSDSEQNRKEMGEHCRI